MARVVDDNLLDMRTSFTSHVLLKVVTMVCEEQLSSCSGDDVVHLVSGPVVQCVVHIPLTVHEPGLSASVGASVWSVEYGPALRSHCRLNGQLSSMSVCCSVPTAWLSFMLQSPLNI